MLSLYQVNKHYGPKHALRYFTYTFGPGVYTLLGPNGAGKSTLMNILTDGIRPDGDSRVEYNGKAITALGRSYRARVGYMPQELAVYDGFTCRRFLGYMGALKGLPRAELRRQAAELMERLELSDVLDKKAGSLSGGMKRRLLLAQALLGFPEIVILDEPTAGLDPRQRIIVRELIARLALEEGRTVIVSTHIISDVERIAKAVLILKLGRLVASGSVEELTAALPQGAAHGLEQVYMEHFGRAGELV